MQSEINNGPGGDTTALMIRDVALQHFALHGAEMTSLREVAKAAGMSIGAVQHIFGTKGQLVETVEAYCGEVIQELFQPTPITTDGHDSIDEVAERMNRLLIEYPHVAGYAARSMIDGTVFGTSIFDKLILLGDSRWQARGRQGLLNSDADPRWASLNSFLVGLGGILMRSHLDKYLPEPFTSPRMQSEWSASLNTLFRVGYLTHGPHPNR